MGVWYFERGCLVFRVFRFGREVFTANKPAFTERLNAIGAEYNRKLDAILKEDPGLKREYAITVTARNKVFLDNTLAADGPGVIFCGASHLEDLENQLAEHKVDYAVVVPKSLDWPPTKKDDATIFADMMELGCRLKSCKLRLGDGTAVEVKLPIE